MLFAAVKNFDEVIYGTSGFEDKEIESVMWNGVLSDGIGEIFFFPVVIILLFSFMWPFCRLVLEFLDEDGTNLYLVSRNYSQTRLTPRLRKTN